MKIILLRIEDELKLGYKDSVLSILFTITGVETILRHAPMVIGDLKLVIEDLELGIEDGGF